MSGVLLIEPDRVLSDIYKASLEAAGYTVNLATSAQEAITLADQQTPDLIILEIQLVEHSGIEFLYELRSYTEWLSVPVIINTIVPLIEFKDNYHLLMDELTVKSYLYKPHSSLRELLSTINDIKFQLA